MSANHSYKDSELLSRIAGGDEKAFGKFYQETNGGIYNAVMAYVKDPEAARDIVQVVYIRIWNRRQMLSTVCSLKNYLFILARNAVFDHFKRVTIETKWLAALREQTPELHNNVIVSVQERECNLLLLQSISLLPSRQRQVYLLANEQELSYAEIAAQMHVSRFTVKRHLELARRFVRRYVDRHLHQKMILPLIFIFCGFPRIL
ncbi:MAG: sigma-70 family RNA polymerase sigma factor [Bacteroidota bacterium]|nr:sigma-70 family RNA polymerase sigma factor [Bacteroidota bacterium]